MSYNKNSKNLYVVLDKTFLTKTASTWPGKTILSFSGYESDNHADFEEDLSLESMLPVRNQRLHKNKISSNLPSFRKSSQANKVGGFS